MGGITAEPYSYYKVNGLIHNSQEIDKEIVSIGAGKRVELWSKEEWNKYSQSSSIDEELSKLKDYGV